jgi:hypothetical protein
LNQHLVFSLIRRKIEDLLGGMCFIEWEGASISNRPRPYVDDVISYLQVQWCLDPVLSACPVHPQLRGLRVC